MPEISTPDSHALRDLTTAIASAYVAHNHVSAAELPGLITTVHGALVRLAAGPTDAAEPQVDRPTAAQIRKSITPDGLISFIDGKPYKTLKRHLTKHGLDPKRYRERFGLPVDYPTTAANYSAQRSSLAKALGLGQGGARPAPTDEITPAEEVARAEKTARSGRRKAVTQAAE